MIKRCDNCRTGIHPGTTHEPTRDEIGGGICNVKTFAEHVTECLDNTAATVRGWRKPHLRLHYTPVVQGVTMHYPWSVQMVRDMRPNYGRPNVTTNQHWDAAGALRGARVFWWSSL